MRRGKTAIAAGMLLLSLAGCMAAGRYFDITQAAKLQPGVTTKPEAVQMFGVPYNVSTFPNESQLLQWIYSGPLGGRAHLAVLFDHSGKMIRITQQSF